MDVPLANLDLAFLGLDDHVADSEGVPVAQYINPSRFTVFLMTAITASKESRKEADNRFQKLGEKITRYGLVTVIGYIGLLKFTPYEAEGIEPFVANNPLTSWMYSVFSVQTTAEIIGVWEIVSAVLIALRPRSSPAAAIGSGMATIMFLTTLSSIVTTPGVWHEERGFPFMSAAPGQFLIKDLVLLGASLWTLGEALKE